MGEDQMGVAAALIDRMARGDGRALTELYGMWSPILLGASVRMLGDRHEAEEIVQDTFVRIWHRSVDYDPSQSPPFAWAFAVMRGYCIDRLRYRHREKRDSSRVVPIHLHAPTDNRAKQGVVDTRSAVPIYDPATGIGTLVVNNLSNTNFWVTEKGESEPRLLGKIPPSTEAYESVGFELRKGTTPENFIITNDSAGKDAPPSDKNTILIGPQ